MRDLVPEVELDEFGLLRADDRWVALTPIEERILRCLLPRYGQLVPLTEIVDAVWPGEVNWRPRLHARLRGLRRKLAEVHLAIIGVRGRGVVLESEWVTRGSGSAHR